ncbi:STAS domain-containing protein [Chloroflexus sp.]|uniref:STAS domain-containing protein n=1 Tax=Chloroflexus sp. TaxID=1904827 RepID=UPI0026308497|nr:STAS domain-containing protein [uncultured Chloroflexus sp.]
MLTSSAFIEQTYRRIARAIASWTLTLDTIVLVSSLVVFLLTASPFARDIAGIALASATGCALTLWFMARNYPLWQATIPFALSIIVCELLVAFWFPELRLAVAPFLAVVILLAGLQQDRRFTIGAMILCIVVIIGIVGLIPTAEESAIPQTMLTFLRTTSIAALIIAIWAFLDRILRAQMQALQLADERAIEAETARQATEMARRELEQRATEQQRLLEVISALELPVLKLDDQVLLAPLVGNLDSRRTEQLRHRILEMVATQRAHTVIIDITGVAVIDTAVAKGLIDTAAAIRLLGARTIVTGIRPGVAQTLVHLNAGLGNLITAPNPEMAMRLAHQSI